MYLLQLKYHYRRYRCQQSGYLVYQYPVQADKLVHFLDHRGPNNLEDEEYQHDWYRIPVFRKFLQFFYFRDAWRITLLFIIKEVNVEARDKTSESSSGEITVGVLKQLRNSSKSRLSTSASYNCDILGGQGTGSFSLSFPTNLLTQTFIRVSSVLLKQEITASCQGFISNSQARNSCLYIWTTVTFVINYIRFVLLMSYIKSNTISILTD